MRHEAPRYGPTACVMDHRPSATILFNLLEATRLYPLVKKGVRRAGTTFWQNFELLCRCLSARILRYSSSNCGERLDRPEIRRSRWPYASRGCPRLNGPRQLQIEQVLDTTQPFRCRTRSGKTDRWLVSQERDHIGQYPHERLLPLPRYSKVVGTWRREDKGVAQRVGKRKKSSTKANGGFDSIHPLGKGGKTSDPGDSQMEHCAACRHHARIRRDHCRAGSLRWQDQRCRTDPRSLTQFAHFSQARVTEIRLNRGAF